MPILTSWLSSHHVTMTNRALQAEFNNRFEITGLTLCNANLRWVRLFKVAPEGRIFLDSFKFTCNSPADRLTWSNCTLLIRFPAEFTWNMRLGNLKVRFQNFCVN